MRFRFLLALGGLFIAWQAQAERVLVEDQAPRSFGYVIGDTLERRITLKAEQAFVLEAASLPRPGKQTAWVALLEVSTAPKPGVSSAHQTVRLRYQIRNAPTQTRSVALPAFTLRFRDSKAPGQIEIGGSSVTVAPIIPPNQGAATLFLRPDRSPQRISPVADFRRLILFVVAALALLVYAFMVPMLASRRAPFARAYREIRRAAQGAVPSRGYQQALRALHRAFDETAGQRLFADQLEEFFARRPQFAELRPSTEAFLMMSQREFFANGHAASGAEFSWLLEFSRACRAHEREVR